MNKIRLRLAPSPTGFLHIGNLRTALFGYLLAKSLKGDFILRIEDTDEKREVAGAVDSLIKILDWIGLNFDEGPHKGGDYGPYIQSERKDIYNKLVTELLEKDGAYHCFCSSEDLTKMREEQQAAKLPPRYDRRCRNLSKDEVAAKISSGASFIIRQKLPLSGEIIVHDELRGDISFQCSDLEDHALIKSNGVPTYQFASVVDDHLMGISHVTRGDEWLPSFPKNILLYQAFGWTPPLFIHLPLILNKTGGKLSKRQGDVFVEQYKDRGYLPEALINFCALLGWHPKHDKEVLSLSELEQEFSIDGMGSSPAIFDEDKLDYYNGLYIRQKSDAELLSLLKLHLDNIEAEDDYLLKIIPTIKDRLKNLNDFTELSAFYFAKDLVYEASLLIWKGLSTEQIKNNLSELLAQLELIPESDWQA
ncbi:MAG TPA: glutamate--tRNA ligase, partial [bacterium]|nr:glutamate--tRNA ligase [bacterium]